MSEVSNENLRTVYAELCGSYRAVDDFRGKLLGFLPLVSATGISLLIREPGKHESVPTWGLPLAAFGFLVTVGLFIFEIYGIRRCTHLILMGECLERHMHAHGQFTHRPLGLRTLGKSSGGLAPFVSEPLASGIIYSAVLGAWAFLICFEMKSVLTACLLASGVFCAAFFLSQTFNRWLLYVDLAEKRKQLGLPCFHERKAKQKA